MHKRVSGRRKSAICELILSNLKKNNKPINIMPLIIWQDNIEHEFFIKP